MAVLQGTLPFTCGLFFSLNVYENVALPYGSGTAGLRRGARGDHDPLGMVGLRDRAELMPEELSAGMCKRVAIAGAALEARIVIVDDFDWASTASASRCSARCSPTSRARAAPPSSSPPTT